MKKTYDQPEIKACWAFINVGDYKRAIEAGKLAVEKYPKDPEAYLCLGLAYFEVEELKLALENLKKAESLINNKAVLMQIYNIIGRIFHRMGYLDDALLYCIRSLSLAKDLGNKDLQVSILNNIAGIYKDKGELDKALSYYEEALSLQTRR